MALSGGDLLGKAAVFGTPRPAWLHAGRRGGAARGPPRVA
eukprot:gene36863-48191_t